VRLAGTWQATDPDEEFWFYHPSALTGQLLVPPESFVARVAPVLADEIVLGLWYLVMDGSKTHAEDINPLFERITTVQNRVAAYLPYTELDGVTLDILATYRRDAQVLTILLYAFSMPVIGLTLAFVLLVMGLSVERRRGEIAVLRSRGASIGQVVGIAAEEGLLVGAAALTSGLVLGGVIVQTMGRTRSFLVMGLLEEAGVGDAWLRVGLTSSAAAFGVAAVMLAVLAGVAPALGAARHTMVTYKQERARLLRRPWWQRVGLDVALLVPVIYGAYVLRKQGALVLPIGNAQAVGDPFQDPLLFFVPALAVWAITLLLLRCLPGLMRAFGHLLGYTRSTGFLLAARQLSRMPGFYTAPLVLLVLTLSLSAYTASLAQTLDAQMYDEAFYRIGADLRLDPPGSETTGADAAPGLAESAEPWLSVPVSEYARAPGAVAAARVGRYPAVIRLASGAEEGAYIGLDRLDFPKVAFWRRDFAAQRLGGLMNALASAPEAVLLPREFLEANALRIGDTVRVQVETEGQLTQLDLRIAGDFELFPTWYPDEGPLVVGNLDYLYESAGSEHPYAVWLNTERGADPVQTVAGVRRRGMRMGSWNAPLIRVARAQVQPERQGLFGLLSAGFVASAVLTAIGFLIYAIFSFRRRAIEIGMLRAIGLSDGQMAAFLAWELGFLVVVGLVAGTVLGVWSSKLFIPYLQIGAEASARIPPYSVTVAWPAIFRIYALFAVLFLAALAVLLILLSRMHLFQAIKLGEAA
jgi:putative ABC transport system permease protein